MRKPTGRGAIVFKVTKTEGSESKTAASIDFLSDLERVPDDIKAKIKQDVGDFLVESILTAVSKAKSPVAGESWPALSKEYKAKKEDEGAAPKANMEEHGDMLNSLTFRETPNGIEIGFFDDQAWKADGHLKFSGKENHTPKRRFIPAEGQNFTADIQVEIDKIIADNLADAETFKRGDFSGVDTTSALYEVLRRAFGDMSVHEIRAAVTRSPYLTQLLDDLDLMELL